MEDRRTAIAIFLCILVVMVYSELFLAPVTRPPAANKQTVSEKQDKVVSSQNFPTPGAPKPALTTDAKTETITTSNKNTDKTPPSPAELNQAGFIELSNKKFIAQISLLGGRISSFKLKEHRVALDSKELLDLVDKQDNMPLPLGVGTGSFSDIRVQYAIDQSATSAPVAESKYQARAGEGLSLTLRGAFPSGAEIVKRLQFSDNGYLIKLDTSLSEATPEETKLWLEWSEFLPESAAGGRYDVKGFVALRADDKLDDFPALDTEEGSEAIGNVRWLSFGDKYFMRTLISPKGSRPANIGRQGDMFFAKLEGEPEKGSFNLFVGPKEYKKLQKIGFELHRNVDLGIFSFLAHPLLGCIRLFYSFLGNYGLAIILLTLLIKALFLPLTKASFTSMRAMQDLQPEIKALRERVKDPTQLNQEMMALYKKRGVNPMGGCLPMLIQLPVFLGLYNALLNSIELRHSPFALWVTDLSAPEGLMILGINVPVMILIMGLSMFLQQWMTPSAMDPQQKKVMMLMPVVFTVMFIIFPFPSGLVLYWLVNNIISIIQQVYIKKEKTAGPLQATAIASVVIFAFGYILTLL